MRAVIIIALALASGVSAAWTEDASLKARALGRTPSDVPRFAFNLDLPAGRRWDAIAPLYKAQAPDILNYLLSYVPKWVVPIIEAIGNDIHPYFGDYGDEMVGAAAALGLKPGDIVMLNLAYQLEYLGLNCSNWNNTGPTVPDDPGCVDVDPKQDWCYCQALQRRGYDVADERTMLPPADGWRQGRRGAGGSGSGSSGGRDGSSYVSGPCTSVVAEDAHGSIWHGRNLDWNLPPVLRSLVVDLDYQRGNETVFTGTTFVGFSGVMSGIRAGGWSASIDARGKGGKLSKNLLQALLQHSATPSQHLRKALETAATFSLGVQALSTGPLVNENYYIAAGAARGEGVVIARGRKAADDLWFLNETEAFFRLETNYDHFNPVPEADDRRTPGNAHMRQLGRGGVGEDGILGVMKAWPTFNVHTDYTGVFNPASGLYRSMTWSD